MHAADSHAFSNRAMPVGNSTSRYSVNNKNMEMALCICNYASPMESPDNIGLRPTHGAVDGPYERLLKLGVALPDVSPPKGVYTPAVRSGRLIFVSGQVPLVNGELTAVGTVGAKVDMASARKLTRSCALAALAAVNQVASLEEVTHVVKVTGYVACAAEFTAVDAVVDGASELLIAVFGDSGRHARSVVGVARLPLNSPVEIEVTVEIDG